MKLPAHNSQTKREFHELQKLMASAIMRPLARGDKMQVKWIDGEPTEIVVNQFIKPNDRLTSFERLEIYNRQYWFRLLDSFYDDYPGLRAVLGDRVFTLYTLLNAAPTSHTALRALRRAIKNSSDWLKPILLNFRHSPTRCEISARGW